MTVRSHNYCICTLDFLLKPHLVLPEPPYSFILTLAKAWEPWSYIMQTTANLWNDFQIKKNNKISDIVEQSSALISDESLNWMYRVGRKKRSEAQISIANKVRYRKSWNFQHTISKHISTYVWIFMGIRPFVHDLLQSKVKVTNFNFSFHFHVISVVGVHV